MGYYLKSTVYTQILRTVKDFPTVHFWAWCFVSWSWTRAHRTDVHFPNRSQNVSRSLRRFGPVYQSWAFALVSCVVEHEKAETASTSRTVRWTFHVPCVAPVQCSVSKRFFSYPFIKSGRINEQIFVWIFSIWIVYQNNLLSQLYNYVSLLESLFLLV